MHRRRSTAVSVSLVAALSVTMTGCGSPDTTEYNGVCVDRRTNTRVDDDRCDESRGGGHGWVYYRPGQSVPAVGGVATGGTTTVPDGASVARGGGPAKGGVVARGGFGGGKGGSVGG
jgi:hypothetical protein